MSELFQWDGIKLMRKGIGKVQAITLLSAFELGGRLTHTNGETVTLEQALMEVENQIRHASKESFFLICLNMRNKCIGPPIRIGEGTKYQVSVDPREVLNKAIQREAGRLVLIHNHPSSDARPSPQDILLTKQIIEGSAWMDIELYDHVIVTKKECFSMRENGYLKR